MAWSTPLLDGEIRDRAGAAVAAIDDHLLSSVADGPDLARGGAGLAIYWAYRAHERGDIALDAAVAHLAAAADAMPQLGGSLYHGLTGVAWAVAHLDRRMLAESDEDRCEEVDELLLDRLFDPAARPLGHDLVTGLAGIG